MASSSIWCRAARVKHTSGDPAPAFSPYWMARSTLSDPQSCETDHRCSCRHMVLQSGVHAQAMSMSGQDSSSGPTVLTVSQNIVRDGFLFAGLSSSLQPQAAPCLLLSKKQKEIANAGRKSGNVHWHNNHVGILMFLTQTTAWTMAPGSQMKRRLPFVRERNTSGTLYFRYFVIWSFFLFRRSGPDRDRLLPRLPVLMMS